MKKLLLVIPLLLAAAFVWLGTMKHPAPVAPVEKALPSAQVLGN